MGFDHHTLLLTLPSLMFHFYGKSEEAGSLHIIACVWSALSGRPVLF